jgi:hypothetical protein
MHHNKILIHCVVANDHKFDNVGRLSQIDNIVSIKQAYEECVMAPSLEVDPFDVFFPRLNLYMKKYLFLLFYFYFFLFCRITHD